MCGVVGIKSVNKPCKQILRYCLACVNRGAVHMCVVAETEGACVSMCLCCRVEAYKSMGGTVSAWNVSVLMTRGANAAGIRSVNSTSLPEGRARFTPR